MTRIASAQDNAAKYVMRIRHQIIVLDSCDHQYASISLHRNNLEIRLYAIVTRFSSWHLLVLLTELVVLGGFLGSLNIGFQTVNVHITYLGMDKFQKTWLNLGK